jgi:hypothetical protein
MAANTGYTLASVPLALRYLSKQEFGLWAVTSQLALYAGLLDFGMSGAGMRILIDHKDRTGSNYGSVIQTGVLVNLAHAFLVLLCGVGAAFILGPLLNVPPELEGAFRWLVGWQSLLLAISFSVRTAVMILTAHQRYDVANYTQALLFALSFGVLWAGFERGSGVFSLLWAQGVAQVLGAAATMFACVYLKLLPARGQWGRPAWRWFWELFAYGRDMFLYSLGNLLINFSQTLVISRVYGTQGLEMGAVWSVCTRAFTLLTQMVYRIDYAWAGLAEMLVRGEKPRLFSRFRSLVMLSGSLSVVAGVAFAVSNQPFVQWWTKGQFGWSPVNDWLLAFWLVVLVLVRMHTGLVGVTKDFRFLRYLFLVEGLFFLSVGWIALRYGGVTAMLIVSVAGTLLISFPYSVKRTIDYFQLPARTVALAWIRPAIRLACWLVPLGLAVGWLAQGAPPLWRFLTCAGFLSCVGAALFLRWGLDEPIQKEIVGRIPARFRWLRQWVWPDRTLPA